MAYQPGVGIQYTAALTLPDIGNVPNPQRVRSAAGMPGRMNGGDPAAARPEGTIYYKPQPDPADVEALADLCGVGARTVESWFGVPGPNGQVQYRNCVPVRNNVNSSVPGALGARLCSMSFETRRRCIVAAPLAVDGGIYRDPLYTYGDKQNGGLPFVIEIGYDTLAECVEEIEQTMDGDKDYILMVGWVQMQIEPDGGGGWTVTIYHFYPQNDEYKEKTVEAECPG